ncbi:unnamed protein product [Cuscuta epithymum]|uniref:Uncharacterized protein n=1 Tax=Cuscuta epithymum TaxID=186058 RepID=A0AAV0E6P7_9ASTE|nr:unnamed protein product [Cuscuta epithymum]
MLNRKKNDAIMDSKGKVKFGSNATDESGREYSRFKKFKKKCSRFKTECSRFKTECSRFKKFKKKCSRFKTECCGFKRECSRIFKKDGIFG